MAMSNLDNWNNLLEEEEEPEIIECPNCNIELTTESSLE